MKQAILGVLGLGLLAGCAGPRMVPPSEIANASQVLEVADRSSMTGALVNESFKLGSFQVVDVDRDWNKSIGFGVGGYSRDSTTTAYSYGLKGSGAAWTGTCASKADSQGVAVLGGHATWGKTSIFCECKQVGATASLALKNLSPNSSNGMSGELSTGSAKYKVSEVIETDKSNFTGGPAGFRFDGEAGSVGAVEVLRPGRVWLNERLPEADRTSIACLSAGLILYEPPSD